MKFYPNDRETGVHYAGQVTFIGVPPRKGTGITVVAKRPSGATVRLYLTDDEAGEVARAYWRRRRGR